MNSKYYWRVILVTDLQSSKKYMEFSVKSKNILGATMKANKTLKSLNEDNNQTWWIKSVSWQPHNISQGEK